VLLPTRAQNANSIQARMRVPPEEMFVVMRCGPAAARRMFAFPLAGRKFLSLLRL
jgi:hypothetical protein